jgi:hypothetical protein
LAPDVTAPLGRDDAKRFNPWRIKNENPALFQEIKAKSDEMRLLCYPTEAEVMTYAAEFASLFPEVDCDEGI